MKSTRRKIGDRSFRVPRPQPFSLVMTPARRRQYKHVLTSNPLLVSVSGILLVIVAGTVLLMLPPANAQGIVPPPFTAFFTAASAVSTTGLTTVTTATYWTPFGQAVIGVLIFLGGLGLVAAVMFSYWLTAARITLQERLLIREAMGVHQLGGLVQLLRNVVLIDLAITTIGALLLIEPFRQYYGPSASVWQALFHSVSAFNTAGFDLIGPAGFAPISRDAAILLVTTVEGVLGAISFTVLMEVPRVRRWRRFSLNTRVVLLMTPIAYVLATVAIFAGETLFGDSLSGFSTVGGFLTSVFNGLSASTTTGFATIDFSGVTTQALLILTIVMFVGGATGSTSGGTKLNTFAVILANIWSGIKGKEETEMFGREIPFNHVVRAAAVAAVGLTVLLSGILLIVMTTPGIPFEHVLFEATSAFGTVGLSTGILAQLSTAGQAIVIVLMVVGRVTPLSMIMVLARRRQYALYRHCQEEIFQG